MRRLILEVSEKELAKIGIELPQSQKIKSLELLYFLKQDTKEFAAISRVEFKDPLSEAVDVLLVNRILSEVQILEHQKNGTYIIFMRGPSLTSVLKSIGVTDGYLFPSVAIHSGNIKISYLGSEHQVKNFLEKVNAQEIRYKVVSLADANFSLSSPLNQLTEKQREVLIAAFRLGYYDIPRRITSEQLASKLDLVNSTVVEHLRKAERRLLVSLLTEQS